MATRVLLADDHDLVRQSIRRSLQDAGSIDVVGEARTGREALTLAKELNPDVVIIDVGMPDLNGIDATRQLLANHRKLFVIGLSAHAERRYINAMLEAGAVGYVLKENTLRELVDAVRVVMRGKKYLSPDVADVIITTPSGRELASELTAYSVLGERERHVLQLLSEGHTSKEIAKQLNISAATVDTHRRNIMRKLNLHSVAELTRYAIREALTEL